MIYLKSSRKLLPRKIYMKRYCPIYHITSTTSLFIWGTSATTIQNWSSLKQQFKDLPSTLWSSTKL